MAALPARTLLPINGERPAGDAAVTQPLFPYFAHPTWSALVERLRPRPTDAGWPGILVGDMSQGRAAARFSRPPTSVGLDGRYLADAPMPNGKLSRQKTRRMSAFIMIVRGDRLDVDPHVLTPTPISTCSAPRRRSPRAAASSSTPPIKMRCAGTPKGDRGWLSQGAADVLPRLSFPYPDQMPSPGSG